MFSILRESSGLTFIFINATKQYIKSWFHIPLILFIKRRNVTGVHAHLFCLQYPPHDLAAAGLGQGYDKFNFRWHSDGAKRYPHMVQELVFQPVACRMTDAENNER